jgi:hypothetical protein
LEYLHGVWFEERGIGVFKDFCDRQCPR